MKESDHAPDQYAAIAAAYREAERMPVRIHAEFPTLLGALGPVDGADVLDLACGTGLFSRMLAERGARHVTGVDTSAAMIDQARAGTPVDSQVDYLVGDVVTMPHLGEFDVVTAVFLLNYATTGNELAGMCDSIAGHLRPGGRFVGCLPNSEYDWRRPDDRYQIRVHWSERMRDGERYRLDLLLSTTLTIECTYWTLDTYRRTLQDSGLREVEFQPWTPTRQAIGQHGAEFWRPWTDNPVNVVVTGRKAE